MIIAFFPLHLKANKYIYYIKYLNKVFIYLFIYARGAVLSCLNSASLHAALHLQAGHLQAARGGDRNDIQCLAFFEDPFI